MPENSSEEPNTSPDERAYMMAGVHWRVYEDPCREAPKYGPSLVFMSLGVARRVRNYPLNWRELSDDDLHLISELI